MGRKLAARIPKEFPDSNIDVIVPVPDSGRIAAMELAKIWASRSVKDLLRIVMLAAHLPRPTFIQ